MISSEQALRVCVRGFFLGAVLLGALVCIGTASAQCGPAAGTRNTACGTGALISNTKGFADSAFGYNALDFNTTGYHNSASGAGTLHHNTTGYYNTASGAYALFSNTTRVENTASGAEALDNNTGGGNNIGLGYFAGYSIVTGSNNIDIGGDGGSDESNTIRIGYQGTQNATFIAGIDSTAVSSMNPVCISSGQLGVCSSSARYKRDIRDMGAASSGLMKLRPVVFRYRSDAKSQRQYGLIAEEVARVYPELVDYDHEGKPLTVRCLELNAMLLNELQKQDNQLQTQTNQLREQTQQNKQLSAENRELRLEVAQVHAAQERERASFDQRLDALERAVWASQSATRLSAVAMRTEASGQERQP